MSVISLDTIREWANAGRRKLDTFRAWMSIAMAYRQVYATSAGRLVIQDLLIESGVLKVGHDPADPQAVTWADGRRSLGLHIMERLRFSEAELMKLAQERIDQEEVST